MLTIEQQMLRNHGLPYDGPQPAMAAMLAYSGQTTRMQKADRYYSADGRHGPHNLEELYKVAAVHGMEFVDHAPPAYNAIIIMFHGIDKNGNGIDAKGNKIKPDSFVFSEPMDQDNLDVWRGEYDAYCPGSYALAKTISGESLQKATTPRVAVAAFNTQSISDITRSVALRFRDSTSTPGVNVSHARELAQVCRPTHS